MSQSITVSAAEANRSFSKLLRHAREGGRVTITSHGKPVAELGPAQSDIEAQEKRRQAIARMRERWAQSEPIVIGPWTRDELYDRR